MGPAPDAIRRSDGPGVPGCEKKSGVVPSRGGFGANRLPSEAKGLNARTGPRRSRPWTRTRRQRGDSYPLMRDSRRDGSSSTNAIRGGDPVVTQGCHQARPGAKDLSVVTQGTRVGPDETDVRSRAMSTTTTHRNQGTSSPEPVEYRRPEGEFGDTTAPSTTSPQVDDLVEVGVKTVFVSAERQTKTVSLSYRQGDDQAALLRRRIREALAR